MTNSLDGLKENLRGQKNQWIKERTIEIMLFEKQREKKSKKNEQSLRDMKGNIKNTKKKKRIPTYILIPEGRRKSGSRACLTKIFANLTQGLCSEIKRPEKTYMLQYGWTGAQGHYERSQMPKDYILCDSIYRKYPE